MYLTFKFIWECSVLSGNPIKNTWARKWQHVLLTVLNGREEQGMFRDLGTWRSFSAEGLLWSSSDEARDVDCRDTKPQNIKFAHTDMFLKSYKKR